MTHETAPQFIWRALQQNMTVIAEATGKANEYKTPEFYDVPDERCWMCAGETRGRGILVADRITDMFSDVHHMKLPESKSLCEACYGLQSQRRFRFYSTLATEDGVRHLARDSWAEILTSPPPPPWAALLATSGQKHLFFKTRINHDNGRVYVQMEDLGIEFPPAELSELLTIVERMYTIFTKAEIESGNYDSRRILQYGMGKFDADEREVARYRGGRLLTLAVWIARKDEEAREKRLAVTEQRNKAFVAKRGEAPETPEPEAPKKPEPAQLSLF